MLSSRDTWELFTLLHRDWNV
eukprot:COSAG01_NODE_60407_length_295_cov_0.581633_1_plen_20_part_10